MVRLINLLIIIAIVAASTINAAQQCLPAPVPSGNFKKYDFPRLGQENNKRQLQSKNPLETPDTSLVLNAQYTLRAMNVVSLEIENKSLMTGGTSDRQLIYEFTLKTTTSTRISRYWLSNTDNCQTTEQFTDVDWSANAILAAKIYWTNPH